MALFTVHTGQSLGFSDSSVGKESACNTGDPGSIPGLGRAPVEGKGYPLQYSCLENPMDRGAWWATVPSGHKESDTTEGLSRDATTPDTTMPLIRAQLALEWQEVIIGVIL